MIKNMNIDDLKTLGSTIEPGRYPMWEVFAIFKRFYGERFTSHDMNKICVSLGYKKTHRTKGGFNVTVK